MNEIKIESKRISLNEGVLTIDNSPFWFHNLYQIFLLIILIIIAIYVKNGVASLFVMISFIHLLYRQILSSTSINFNTDRLVRTKKFLCISIFKSEFRCSSIDFCIKEICSPGVDGIGYDSDFLFFGNLKGGKEMTLKLLVLDSKESAEKLIRFLTANKVELNVQFED